MVKVTYRLIVGTSQHLFEKTYTKFEPKDDFQRELWHILSATSILAFKNLLNDTWTAIPTEHIKQRGQIQIAKIQNCD